MMLERDIQKAVFHHLRVRGTPGVVAWHTPNGGYRRPIEAKIFKSMGVTAGIPDVLILRGGRLFCLELKSTKGRVSEKQAEAIQAMRDAGALAEVAEGLDEALIILESWGLLRRAA